MWGIKKSPLIHQPIQSAAVLPEYEDYSLPLPMSRPDEDDLEDDDEDDENMKHAPQQTKYYVVYLCADDSEHQATGPFFDKAQAQNWLEGFMVGSYGTDTMVVGIVENLEATEQIKIKPVTKFGKYED